VPIVLAFELLRGERGWGGRGRGECPRGERGCGGRDLGEISRECDEGLGVEVTRGKAGDFLFGEGGGFDDLGIRGGGTEALFRGGIGGAFLTRVLALALEANTVGRRGSDGGGGTLLLGFGGSARWSSVVFSS